MIEYLYLGRVDYDEGLRLQAEIAELRYQGLVENVLLLLEHPPVLTLGRNANHANVLASADLLARRGVTVHEINRGGDVTYHGPGQLVGYPIFDLRTLRTESGGRMGPVDFVRQMEEALIRLCGSFGVRAGRIKGLTGVWCGGNRESGNEGLGTGEQDAGHRHDAPERKIGAIGIHVSRGITSHGFAFNVTTDLRNFDLIVPCGIADHAVTSLEKEVDRPAELPGLEAVAHQAARQFGMVLGQQVLAVETMDALRAQAAARADSQAARPEFPAEDTPMRVPAELERLTHVLERPAKC
jgi:lipoyl(octanoyl) transferase